MMKAIHDLVPDYRDSLTEAIDAIDEDDFCRVPAHFDTLPNLSLDYSIFGKERECLCTGVRLRMGGFGLMVLPAQ